MDFFMQPVLCSSSLGVNLRNAEPIHYNAEHLHIDKEAAAKNPLKTLTKCTKSNTATIFENCDTWIFSKPKPIPRIVCHRSFVENSNSETDSSVHNDEESFPGSELLTFKPTLKCPVISNEKPFSCLICKKPFVTKRDLRHHETIMHKNETEFSCPVCNKSFTCKLYLRNHVSVHKNEKLFSCSVCNKSFSRKMYLRNHIIIHTNEKPFSCSICDKSFTRKADLKSHIIHTNQKPFSCSVCYKSFARESLLKVHTNDKPFSCSVCFMSFTYKNTLKLYAVVHTNEKPFSCSVCSLSHLIAKEP